jgi:L-ascorbate metabolism protein UlaG (beta-lactamase superfamily)
MDWWDSRNEMGVEINMVPVQHWSKRKLLSKNKSLWGGWVIRSKNFNFLFVGDTGFTPHFLEIGRRLGPFDLAAIPIGAYEPRWFMRSHHMNPEEAVEAHLNLRSQKSVAIHWGTFALTDEPLDEPPIRLKKAVKEKEMPPETFLILKHGESIILR